MATGTDTDNYILFGNGKRLTVRLEDMTASKIGRLFQVNVETLYLTNDTNVAIFPEGASGYFSATNLENRCYYEVHGDQVRSPAATATPTSSAPFSFRRSSSSSSTSSTPPLPAQSLPQRQTPYGKTFQRSVHLAEVVSNRLTTSRTMIIRFTEAEANVDDIAAKVKVAMGSEDQIILTDSQGNEIVDSDGTRNSHYWKQNSRKIYALYEQDFQDFQSGRRPPSRRGNDSTGSQPMDQIKDDLTRLSEVVKNTTSALLTNASLQPAKEGLTCLVCKDLMERPMFATCCQSLLGCRTCVEEWLVTAEHCLKCRAEGFRGNVHEVKGISAVLLFFKNAEP